MSIALAQLPPRLRAFIAVRLDQAIEEIQALKADVSWVKPSNLHLTLRFLGDQAPTSRLGPLSRALIEALSSCAPFCATVAGVGAFPEISRPRVIWVGFEARPLIELAERVEQCALAAGFEPSTRAFAPHLTIGRTRSLRGFGPTQSALVQAQKRQFGRATIDAITIYRSELSTLGPNYYEIFTVKLSGAGGCR
jgi:2'-5' RNA ligase